MAKPTMASRLLYRELKWHGQIYARLKNVMDGVDMAFYDRSSGFGFVYSNLGDLLKRVQAKNASEHVLASHAFKQKSTAVQRDALAELKANVERLQDMHGRLQFMLNEIEGVVKKKS